MLAGLGLSHITGTQRMKAGLPRTWRTKHSLVPGVPYRQAPCPLSVEDAGAARSPVATLDSYREALLRYCAACTAVPAMTVAGGCINWPSGQVVGPSAMSDIAAYEAKDVASAATASHRAAPIASMAGSAFAQRGARTAPGLGHRRPAPLRAPWQQPRQRVSASRLHARCKQAPPAKRPALSSARQPGHGYLAGNLAAAAMQTLKIGGLLCFGAALVLGGSAVRHVGGRLGGLLARLNRQRDAAGAPLGQDATSLRSACSLA
jgi:hypothetical protein